MALFDVGSTVSTIASTAQSVGSAVVNGIGTASRLAGALNNLSNPSALISSLRSLNLPIGGGGAFAATRVAFSGPGNVDDWRVRLSIPNNFFSGSPVLAPLQQAGGLVFPYTPSINITHAASYDDVPITHQNYQFLAYQNSKANSFTITGAFHVEDAVQAQYWIAAVHFLRSATKMYTGDDTGNFQGSPPPILSLNGYGDYVFKNVPVVVTSFSIELPADANYIATTVGAGGFSGFGMASGAAANTVAGMAATASQVAGLTNNLTAAKVATALNVANVASNVVSGVSNLISGGSGQGLGGLFSTSSGATHVPNKSSLTITLQPIYSREAVRQFSLQKFVNGEYVNGTGGYI